MNTNIKEFQNRAYYDSKAPEEIIPQEKSIFVVWDWTAVKVNMH